MGKDQLSTPLNPLKHSHHKTIVYDLIYNPEQTEFLRLAKSAGLRTINGLPMLIGQAEESFFFWTGKQFNEKLKLQLNSGLSAG